jgi:hypothetical protein
MPTPSEEFQLAQQRAEDEHFWKEVFTSYAAMGIGNEKTAHNNALESAKFADYAVEQFKKRFRIEPGRA